MSFRDDIMKRLTIIWIFLVLPIFASDTNSATLDKVRESYNKKLKDLQEAYNKKLQQLNQSMQKTKERLAKEQLLLLQKIKVSETKKGNLEGALAAKSDIEKIESSHNGKEVKKEPPLNSPKKQPKYAKTKVIRDQNGIADLTFKELTYDLLPYINPKSAMKGYWQIKADKLETAAAEFARLELIKKAPKEYSISMSVKALGQMTKHKATALILGLGKEQTILTIYGWDQATVKLENIPGIKGQQVKLNNEMTLHCLVQNGKIMVKIDGKEIYYVESKALQPLYKNWQLNNNNSIALGTRHANLQFSNIKLNVIKP